MLPPHACRKRRLKRRFTLEGHPVVKTAPKPDMKEQYRLFQTGSDDARVNKVHAAAYDPGR